MRRRSPRRSVTPWRSKNSRIWIATLRPLSSRSRNCAAVNWPSGGLGADVDHDLDHLGDRAAQEEMIVRDLVDLSHAAEQLQQPPDLGFRSAEQTARCRARAADGSALPAEQRRDLCARASRPRRQPHLMARQPHPGAVERNLARLRQALQNRHESRAPAGAARAAAAAVPARCRADRDCRRGRPRASRASAL